MLVIGVMTGNSLDAADCVLSRITDTCIEDIAFFSLPYKHILREKLNALRALFKVKETNFSDILYSPLYAQTLNAYSLHITESVQCLLREHGFYSRDVSLIGLHGQTLHHMPPSIIGRRHTPFSLQLADARAIADFTGIPVVSDFRSDDIMNGGEGAPFAPMHLMTLARARDYTSCIFMNAGNTGNVANIYKDASDIYYADGWDAGPFNHFPDMLTRAETSETFDVDGAIGAKGTIHTDILRQYQTSAALTSEGKNFFTLEPPKSSDPAHYHMPAGFHNNTAISLPDRMRTAVYASVYHLFHTLSFRKSCIPKPEALILSGGGWKNPIARDDLSALVHGSVTHPILAEDLSLFQGVRDSLGCPDIISADAIGFTADATEARIFADAAYKFLHAVPFSRPSVTGVNKPTVCGTIRFPHDNIKAARPDVQQAYTTHHGTYKPLHPDTLGEQAVGRSYLHAVSLRHDTLSEPKLSATAE